MSEIKIHTFKDLQNVLKENDFKFCCLNDVNENKIISYNTYMVKPLEHLKQIEKRFNSATVSDGVYIVYFSNSLRGTTKAYKCYVQKGNVNNNSNTNNSNVIIHTKAEEVLSYSAALNYISEIATLKSELQILKSENEALKAENLELQNEIDEAEDKQGLSESGNTMNNVTTFLKDNTPTFLNFLDRHFELQERKYNLEQQKIDNGLTNKQNIKRTFTPKQIQIGSQEHINLLRMYFKNNNENMLNKELDKLEQVNPELYNQLLIEFDLLEPDNNETQN